MFNRVWRDVLVKISSCRPRNRIPASPAKKNHVSIIDIAMTKEKKEKQLEDEKSKEKCRANKSIVSILPPAISEPMDCPLYRPVDAIFSESETRVPVFFPKEGARLLGEVSRWEVAAEAPPAPCKSRGTRRFLSNMAHSGLVSCFGSSLTGGVGGVGGLIPGSGSLGAGATAGSEGRAWVRLEHRASCPPPCKRCKREPRPPRARKRLPPALCHHPPHDPCAPDPRALMEPACKVAIVTGGATGIGFAASYQLLAEGAAHVVIGGADAATGARAASALNRRFGAGRALFLEADVTRTTDFETLFRTALDRYRRVDVLFNNAGVFDDRRWQQSMDVNVKSVLRGCFLAFRYMGADKGGAGGLVVNNAAACAWDVVPSAPFYCAAKRAVVAVTECLGSPLYVDCHRVRTITLCPGFTKTAMFRGAAARHVDSSWSKETERRMHRASVQKMEAVGKAFTFLLRYGCSGHHYLVEDSTIRAVHLPGRPGLSKVIATFL